MGLHISSGENLRGNMLLLLFLLIERDWLLNKTIGLSNLSLSRLRVILLILYSQLQGGKLNLVCDVMIFLSIKNKFAMLWVQLFQKIPIPLITKWTLVFQSLTFFMLSCHDSDRKMWYSFIRSVGNRMSYKFDSLGSFVNRSHCLIKNLSRFRGLPLT